MFLLLWSRGLYPGNLLPRTRMTSFGGGGISKMKISSAVSKWFECLSWFLRLPGVVSCLPSEGAGSGAQPHLLSVPELCRYLAESWLTFQIHLQELLQYKRQNPAQVTSSWNSHRRESEGLGSGRRAQSLKFPQLVPIFPPRK